MSHNKKRFTLQLCVSIVSLITQHANLICVAQYYVWIVNMYLTCVLILCNYTANVTTGKP